MVGTIKPDDETPAAVVRRPAFRWLRREKVQVDRSRWAKGWVLIGGLVMIFRFALFQPDKGDVAENVLAVAVSAYGLFLIGGVVFQYGVLVSLVSVHPDDSAARKVLAVVVGAALYLAGLMAW